jgi:hypothetical protein
MSFFKKKAILAIMATLAITVPPTALDSGPIS